MNKHERHVIDEIRKEIHELVSHNHELAPLISSRITSRLWAISHKRGRGRCLKMKWYEFLDLCEWEKFLARSIFIYCRYVPNAVRRGTLDEIAFDEFRYMWS